MNSKFTNLVLGWILAILAGIGLGLLMIVLSVPQK